MQLDAGSAAGTGRTGVTFILLRIMEHVPFTLVLTGGHHMAAHLAGSGFFRLEFTVEGGPDFGSLFLEELNRWHFKPFIHLLKAIENGQDGGLSVSPGERFRLVGMYEAVVVPLAPNDRIEFWRLGSVDGDPTFGMQVTSYKGYPLLTVEPLPLSLLKACRPTLVAAFGEQQFDLIGQQPMRG